MNNKSIRRLTETYQPQGKVEIPGKIPKLISGVSPAPFEEDEIVSSQKHEEEMASSAFNAPDDKFLNLYLVWTIGRYKNGLPCCDLRAITSSMLKAQLYSKMLRRDKREHEDWRRVKIEHRLGNHLYAEQHREFQIAMGKF